MVQGANARCQYVYDRTGSSSLAFSRGYETALWNLTRMKRLRLLAYSDGCSCNVLHMQGSGRGGGGSALVIFPPRSLPSGNAAAVRVLQVLLKDLESTSPQQLLHGAVFAAQPSCVFFQVQQHQIANA
jgi:hypothetical protein